MTSVVIGEGAYGCVHKPSLKCKNAPVMSYEGKLSKTMDGKHAETELKEYDVIDAIDPELQYHMGKPKACSASNDADTIRAIDKCKYIKSKDIANLKLLIMKDGGLNLADYLYDIKSRTKEEIEMFLIELHRVILGVKVLNENGVVHHDLKPQNIVYNPTEERMNFIDFGHMTMAETLKNRSIQSRNTHAVSHWSFPMEMMFQNKKNYMEFAKLNAEQREQLFPQIRGSMKDHIITFLTYITNMLPKDKALEMNVFLKEQFYDFFVNDLTSDKYNEFLLKSINTTDVYGVGFTILHILGPIKHVLHPMVYEVLMNLCLNAINPKVSDRCDADFLLKSYESILTDSGILSRHGLHIIKHDIVPMRTSAPKLQKDETPDSKIPFVMAESLTPCEQSGRERNPKTGRCAKKCKDGYVRNANFNCAKIKICPEHKEMNPKTRRCVAKCKDGYVRNADFRCTRRAAGAKPPARPPASGNS
jgi:serine/threonine protein kinase